MVNTNKADNIQIIIQDKFKDVHFSIRYITDNKEPEVTMRNLLAYLMTDRNENHPTKQSINLKTDELFALSYDVKTMAYGTKHVMDMKFTTLSERYSKESHLSDALNFIVNCIKKPLINDETFVEDYTDNGRVMWCARRTLQRLAERLWAERSRSRSRSPGCHPGAGA